MVLYGISTCETCRRARRALAAAGREVIFRDVRADPLRPEEIARIVAEFGERAINRQSPSYRSLGPFLKAAEPEAQIAAQPTVMKRPVIEDDSGRWHLGWDAATEAALTA